MDAIGSNSSVQFRLAQAYGVTAQKRGTHGATGTVASRSGATPGDAERALSVGAANAGTGASVGVRSLVGASVGGGIDFVVGDDLGASHSPREVLAMYRNPADRNAAATGVEAGRRLDVVG